MHSLYSSSEMKVFISGQCTSCCMMPCCGCTVCSSRRLVPTARSHTPEDRIYTVTYTETSNMYIYIVGKYVGKLGCLHLNVKLKFCTAYHYHCQQITCWRSCQFLGAVPLPNNGRLISCIRSEVLMVVNFTTLVSGM